jgi:hypothetical protein
MVAVAAVRRASWVALLACALLLLGSAAAASGPHWESDDPNVVIAMRRAAAADRRMREWRAAHANKTQRPVRERCDAAGACVREGIQVALMEGYGIVFCRDCPNAHVEGSFSARLLLRALPLLPRGSIDGCVCALCGARRTQYRRGSRGGTRRVSTLMRVCLCGFCVRICASVLCVCV